MLFLKWSLRIFGAFWVVGGVFTLQQARQANFIDNALELITQEKEDRLVSRFLLLISISTLLTGVGLVAVSRWVFIPLSLLIVLQIVYFFIQRQRFLQAQTDEERSQAQIAPATRNAFIVSLVVAIASLVAGKLGILQ
ncbi:hypothetical protein B6N60_04759 [Richelia sinica FACHB-800]|uniref:Uncharacterized protein n=1 Tax=Richelia sinica FACHB-800 TaxID=1357546 RepID=A0A975TC86_9NOST|nr:hypothetical protein [Richelia sinica]MBD2667276.1 hypothetical protein [Richelia sinica FACHB-800]QXE26032.1 hypothetical protein B6N60_04759 [Richelia sinica FACHB-800]